MGVEFSGDGPTRTSIPLWQVLKTWRGCHGPPRLKGQLDSLSHLGCGFLAFTQALTARCLLGEKLRKAALLFVCVRYFFASKSSGQAVHL